MFRLSYRRRSIALAATTAVTCAVSIGTTVPAAAAQTSIAVGVASGASASCPTPSTRVSVDQAAVGQTITVTGTGFSGCRARTGTRTPSASLQVALGVLGSDAGDLDDLPVMGSARTLADGSFTATFTIPKVVTGPSGDAYLLVAAEDASTGVEYAAVRTLPMPTTARALPLTKVRGATGRYGLGTVFPTVRGLASTPADAVCHNATTRCAYASTYRVAKGDHLYALSRRVLSDRLVSELAGFEQSILSGALGDSAGPSAIIDQDLPTLTKRITRDLYTANRATIGRDADRLKAGQVLRIPGKYRPLIVVDR